MRKLDRPDIDLPTLYADIVGQISSANLKARFHLCLPLVLEAEQEFEAKITFGQIYTIPIETGVNNDLSVTAFKNLYTQQLVAKDTGKLYYNKIILSAPQGLCPLCAHRDVDTLDHYLPKTKFPRLSVVPINLIPACTPCNIGKRFSYPTSPQTETMHPYYDNIEDDSWLVMSVLQSNPVAVVFEVNRVDGWTDLLYERVVCHFDRFELATLYAVQAGRELSGLKKNLQKHFVRDGIDGVVKFLNEGEESWANVNINSWKAVLYRGLALDVWFCSGGFESIGIQS